MIAGGTLPSAADDAGSIVQAQEVAVRFGATTALVSASIEVASGELVAVVGPSGSGKSTLLHCLAGLVAPRSGQVCFDGVDLHTLDDSQRSGLRLRRMGMVFQSVNSFPSSRSSRTLLCHCGCSAKIVAMQQSEPRRCSTASMSSGWLASVPPKSRVVSFNAPLLRGRLCIALRSCSPTNRPERLTPANAQIVMKALVGSAREQGAAVVLVTHETRLASYCDRDVLVRDGVIGTSDASNKVIEAVPVGDVR